MPNGLQLEHQFLRAVLTLVVYIGIDPGVGGGIAALSESGNVELAMKMPTTERDLLLVLLPYTPRSGERSQAKAVLERVSASPQMGVVSAFTFGKGYGKLLMALAASDIQFDEVVPAVWQKLLGCRTGGDKNISKHRAQQLFPRETITHALADALLIAEFCRRMTRGMFSQTQKEKQ